MCVCVCVCFHLPQYFIRNLLKLLRVLILMTLIKII